VTFSVRFRICRMSCRVRPRDQGRFDTALFFKPLWANLAASVSVDFRLSATHAGLKSEAAVIEVQPDRESGPQPRQDKPKKRA